MTDEERERLIESLEHSRDERVVRREVLDRVLEIIDTFKDPLPEDAWLIGYDQAATDIYAAIEALKGGE